MRNISTAIALTLIAAAPAYAKTVTYAGDVAPAVTDHETAAPSWSFACMTDHGPSQCGQPIWIYR